MFDPFVNNQQHVCEWKMPKKWLISRVLHFMIRVVLYHHILNFQFFCENSSYPNIWLTQCGPYNQIVPITSDNKSFTISYWKHWFFKGISKETDFFYFKSEMIVYKMNFHAKFNARLVKSSIYIFWNTSQLNHSQFL